MGLLMMEPQRNENTERNPEMNTTEIKAKAFRAAVDLATVCKPCTYDNVLDLTAIALGIEMDDNEEYPAASLTTCGMTSTSNQRGHSG